jgi:hypothetical protein
MNHWNHRNGGVKHVGLSSALDTLWKLKTKDDLTNTYKNDTITYRSQIEYKKLVENDFLINDNYCSYNITIRLFEMI